MFFSKKSDESTGGSKDIHLRAGVDSIKRKRKDCVNSRTHPGGVADLNCKSARRRKPGTLRRLLAFKMHKNGVGDQFLNLGQRDDDMGCGRRVMQRNPRKAVYHSR